MAADLIFPEVSLPNKAEASASFVRSSILTEYRRLSLTLSLDYLAMMAKVGISRRYLADPDLNLPMSQIIDLFEITAHTYDIPDFGLQLGEIRGLPDLGQIILLLREADDARSALRSLTNLLHLHSNALYLTLDERGELPILTVDLIGENVRPSRQAMETSIAGATAIMRWLLGQDWNPENICFTHSRPQITSRHQKLFRCNVSFMCELNGIVLNAGDLDRKVAHSDPVFRRQIQRAFSSLQQPSLRGYVYQVRQVIAAQLPHGDAKLEIVAELVGTNARTLHRRLAAANTSFTLLLDEVRRGRLLQEMTNGQRSLTDIACQMGFGSSSAFSRWFRKTFEMSPRQWRQTHSEQRSA